MCSGFMRSFWTPGYASMRVKFFGRGGKGWDSGLTRWSEVDVFAATEVSLPKLLSRGSLHTPMSYADTYHPYHISLIHPTNQNTHLRQSPSPTPALHIISTFALPLRYQTASL